MAGVEYQVTKVDPTNPETKGMVYQVHKVSEEVAATLGGKVYRARIINDPTEPTVAGKVYQIVLIDDPDDPAVKGKVYNAILIGGSEAVIVGPAVSPLNLPDAIADSLSYVKAFGGTEQRNLPDNYIQRDYIYFIIGAYLLTDIVPTYDYKIEIDFGTTSVLASKTVLGGRTATYGGMELIIASSKNFVVDAFGTGSEDRYSSSVTAQNNTRYKFTYDNQVATLESGGSTLFTNTMTGTAANGAALCINGNNDNGNVFGIGEIYLYSLKVWNGQGELVADYVPAIQKGTVPVVGFYDTVSGTFKTATAGTFAAGGEAVPTPDAPMDIVSNNGVLVFRDTELPVAYRRILGMTMNNDCFYQTTTYPTGADTLKFSYEWTGETACNVLGCYTTSSAQDNISLYTGSSSSGKYLRYDGGTASSYSLANKRYDVQITPTGSIGMEIEDTWEQKTFTCSVPLCIGTTGAAATSAKFIGNLYGNVEIVGVTKFIPCKRVSDGEIGYYDTANETFITPTGTTPTSLGYDYSHYAVIADGTVETINAHGKNLFDSSLFDTDVGNTLTYVTYSIPNGTYTMSSPDYPQETAANVFVLPGEVTTGASTPNNGVWTSRPRTITVTDGKYTIAYRNRVGGNQNDPADYNWQLESGLAAKDYVPYFNGGTATAEMLLKVGDYQDVQSILDGVVTRNVGVKVLDGTESYVKRSDYAISYSGIERAYGPGVGGKCTHFVVEANNAQTAPIGTLLFNTSNNYLHFFTEFGGDVTSFKAWLADQYAAGTPVTVIYPLAQAVTEQVAPQVLNVQTGDNILEITQASLSNLELEAKYEKESA